MVVNEHLLYQKDLVLLSLGKSLEEALVFLRATTLLHDGLGGAVQEVWMFGVYVARLDLKEVCYEFLGGLQ